MKPLAPLAPIAPYASSSDGQDGGGYLVPADTTWSQILDYAAGTGDLDITDLFAFKGRDGTILHYPTLWSVVTRLSALVGQLVSRTLWVEGPDGERVDTRRANAAVRLLRGSPDGRLPSMTWWADISADFFTDGDGLARIVRSGNTGEPMGLVRLSPWDAGAQVEADGSVKYRGRDADVGMGQGYYPERDVVHARWPRVRRQRAGAGAGGSRWLFSVGPIVVARAASATGNAATEYVRQWFESSGAHRAGYAISMKPMIPPRQREEVRKYLRSLAKSREPLVMGGGATITQLNPAPQSEATQKLREFQLRDVCRIYGVQPAALGEAVTGVGSTVAEVSRMMWRFGLSQHMDSILSPFSQRLLTNGNQFRVDPLMMLRGDPAGLAGLVTATAGDAQRDPILTREELRQTLGFPRDASGTFLTTRSDTPPASDEGPDTPSEPEPDEDEEAGLDPDRVSSWLDRRLSEIRAEAA